MSRRQPLCLMWTGPAVYLCNAFRSSFFTLLTSCRVFRSPNAADFATPTCSVHQTRMSEKFFSRALRLTLGAAFSPFPYFSPRLVVRHGHSYSIFMLSNIHKPSRFPKYTSERRLSMCKLNQYWTRSKFVCPSSLGADQTISSEGAFWIRELRTSLVSRQYFIIILTFTTCHWFRGEKFIEH